MGNWYSNKEFVSARAECQLVKDGVQSWEAVGLPVDKTASPPTRSRCSGLLGRLCEKKAVRADCFLSAERTSRSPRRLCWVSRRLRTGPASTRYRFSRTAGRVLRRWHAACAQTWVRVGLTDPGEILRTLAALNCGAAIVCVCVCARARVVLCARTGLS
ncbi:hypothetical protein CRENBAI_012588 [Crenichthys baileyi]|uniref:Uncharacterized protein n=1 Tax=Crenichthys baileyi TaxID=28760 RepID=A0AAV9R0P1_9TELE